MKNQVATLSRGFMVFGLGFGALILAALVYITSATMLLTILL